MQLAQTFSGVVASGFFYRSGSVNYLTAGLWVLFLAAGGPMLGEKFFCWWTAAGADEFFGAGAQHDLNRRMILRFIEK